MGRSFRAGKAVTPVSWLVVALRSGASRGLHWKGLITVKKASALWLTAITSSLPFVEMAKLELRHDLTARSLASDGAPMVLIQPAQTGWFSGWHRTLQLLVSFSKPFAIAR